MNLKAKLTQHLGGGLIGAALAVTLGFNFVEFPNLPGAKKLLTVSYDLPFLLRKPITPDEVVLVFMDDESHKVLDQPYNRPWDRLTHARLLERLKKDGARAVVMDIVFTDPDPSDPDKDNQLARALKSHGRVILPGDYYVTDAISGSGVSVRPPLDLFREAISDNWGIAQLDQDQDEMVRKHLHVKADTPDASSMTWKAAEVLQVPVALNPENRLVQRWVNYYGFPGTLTNVSYYLALDPNAVPIGYFSNKVVFIGARILTHMTGQRKDEFRNPWSVVAKEYKFMPGVEVQATIFLNLLRGDWLSRLSQQTERVIIVLLGILFGYGLAMFRPVTATLLALAGAVAVSAADYALFSQKNIWFPWMIIAAVQIPVATIWSVLFNSVQLLIQKRLFEQSLEMYLSPKLVKKFANRPDLLKPGAEKQVLSILFSDIAGFTTFSEGMDSDKLAQVMNRYFETAVTKCIHVTDGTVVKFIGDAIFALWNAPELQQDHQERACRAALLLATNIVHFTSGATGVQLRTRIGLHTGVANVGNFGSSTRVDYTALGENINLAARMEGLNKYLGTSVLITSDVEGGVNGKFVTRRAGRFVLKGFERSVTVHELVSEADQAEATRSWRDAFAAALKEFEQGNFDAAEAGFNRAIELHPGDGPSHFFLKQIDEYRDSPPPAGWTGEIELKEK